MIPGHKITQEPLVSEYLYDKPNTKLIDRCLGGLGLQDPSKGLEYQVWEIYYESPVIKIKALTTGDIHTLEQIPGVTELSLSFDQNMNITFSYVVSGKSYLKYYDATTQATSLMFLKDCVSPRLVYDDTRKMESNNSDLICAYINIVKKKLCYRLSRDRYTIERELVSVSENDRLIRVGMSENLRLQFKLQKLI